MQTLNQIGAGDGETAAGMVVTKATFGGMSRRSERQREIKSSFTHIR